jgi:hypothetical protein
VKVQKSGGPRTDKQRGRGFRVYLQLVATSEQYIGLPILISNLSKKEVNQELTELITGYYRQGRTTEFTQPHKMEPEPDDSSGEGGDVVDGISENHQQILNYRQGRTMEFTQPHKMEPEPDDSSGEGGDVVDGISENHQQILNSDFTPTVHGTDGTIPAKKVRFGSDVLEKEEPAKKEVWSQSAIPYPALLRVSSSQCIETGRQYATC